MRKLTDEPFGKMGKRRRYKLTTGEVAFLDDICVRYQIDNLTFNRLKRAKDGESVRIHTTEGENLYAEPWDRVQATHQREIG